eukprot:SAG11_NODE_15174_length_586_cov_2.882957_1_plen_195_part_11
MELNRGRHALPVNHAADQSHVNTMFGVVQPEPEQEPAAAAPEPQPAGYTYGSCDGCNHQFNYQGSPDQWLRHHPDEGMDVCEECAQYFDWPTAWNAAEGTSDDCLPSQVQDNFDCAPPAAAAALEPAAAAEPEPETEPQPDGNIDVRIRAAQRLADLKEVQQKIAALEYFLVVEQERGKLGPPDGPIAEAAFNRW